MKAERGCFGKQQHPSRKAAAGAMWALIRDQGEKRHDFNVYKCPLCSNWHVGHRAAGRRRNR